MDKCNFCDKEIETQGFRPKKFCSDQCRYDFHNKKKKKWTLKKLAKHYRDTGEYLPEARELEDIFIMNKAEAIENKYKKLLNNNICDFDIEDLIDIERGVWLAENGFYRRYKKEIDEVDE